MTAIEGPVRPGSMLASFAVVVGAVSVAAWLIPGVVGMIAVGVAGTLAVILGTSSLVAVPGGVSRRTKVIAAVGITVGLLGLAGLWVTAVLVATIPA